MELSFSNTRFSEAEFLCAKKILENIDPEHFAETDCMSPLLESQVLDATFQGSLIQKPYFRNCTFSGTLFDGNNAVESSIISCSFLGATFRDVCMNYSNLTSTNFISTLLDNCGCSNCDMSGVKITQSTVSGCDFIRSFFGNAEISETSFIHCSFEEADFLDTELTDVDLSQASFDYAHFNSVKLINSILPFWSALRSHGCLNALQHSENVQIKYSSDAKGISVAEFLSKLESLLPYFYKKRQHFVLANVCIFLGRQKDALAYIIEGLQESIQSRDFRTIRHLCELAAQNQFFTIKQLRQLYELLISEHAIHGMSHHEYQLYLAEIREIRHFLVENPYGLPRMVITMQTTLAEDDYIGLSSLLKFWDDSIRSFLPQSIYHISIYRNSPPWLEISICETIVQLLPYLLMIGTIVFGAANKSVKFLQNISTARGLQLDNKEKKTHLKEMQRQDKLKTEQLRLENEKLQLEIDEKKLAYQRQLSQFQSVPPSADGQKELTLAPEVRAQVPCIKYSIQGDTASLSVPRQGILKPD